VHSLWKGYLTLPAYQNFQEFLEQFHFAFAYAHTSGHASFDDLKRLVDAIKPNVLIPIHTEKPAAFGELWANCLYPQDGEIIPLTFPR